jgi:ferredoxin
MKHVLTVDMIACDGRGICADALPERVQLDDWAIPSSIRHRLTALIRHARRANSNCPTLALRLTSVTARVGGSRR